jgi:integrase
VTPAKAPTTPALAKEPIRAELLAQPQYIQQLPSIENLLLYLEGKGRKPATILAYKKNLEALAIRSDLRNPQQVELAIARYTKRNKRPATNNYKSKLCDCYATYCKYYKIEWEKPIYTPEPTSIQPPTEEKCRMLIASAKGDLSLKIDLSVQTGLRPCEIQGEFGLEAKDIHPDQRTVTARIHKGCNPRPPLSITPELATRLQDYITKKNLKSTDRLFDGTNKRYGEAYRRFRNNLAKKLNDATIHNIRLYDLRHCYCTKQLKRTQNTEIVRQLMGHKQLNTTQKYLHLMGYGNADWIVEGTNDKERAKQLLKEDFQYQLTTPDGTMIFRKPK